MPDDLVLPEVRQFESFPVEGAEGGLTPCVLVICLLRENFLQIFWEKIFADFLVG